MKNIPTNVRLIASKRHNGVYGPPSGASKTSTARTSNRSKPILAANSAGPFPESLAVRRRNSKINEAVLFKRITFEGFEQMV